MTRPTSFPCITGRQLTATRIQRQLSLHMYYDKSIQNLIPLSVNHSHESRIKSVSFHPWTGEMKTKTTTQSSLVLWRILWSVLPASWRESLHPYPSSHTENGRIHLEARSILSAKKQIYPVLYFMKAIRYYLKQILSG